MPDRPRPSTPPRHSMHAAPSASGWFPSARQAARIRAIAGSTQLPHERALADATVLTAWLTTTQRTRYAPALKAGGGDIEEFVARLADERRVVLEEGTDPVADEVESAAEAERSARQIRLRLLEALLLLVTGAFLVLAIMELEFHNGLPGRPPVQAYLLLAGVAASALLAAVVGKVATRRRDRALLSWAVDRPGQLGRGIPVRRALQGESAGPALVVALAPALMLGVGIIGMFAGAAVLLIGLLSRQDASMTTAALALLGVGVVSLLVSVVLGRLRGRRLELAVRRARAVEWLGPVAADPAVGHREEPSGGLQDLPGLDPQQDSSAR